ncbi:sigma-70 family RNA polymerase sigma factor [Myxococcota bacterium]|nr:sigma-70 family RNA polymerase sigma factor [Myxococcota bacterium]
MQEQPTPKPVPTRCAVPSNQRAFRAEIEPHLATLRRQIARIAPVAAVDDILQETLLCAWRTWHDQAQRNGGIVIERWGSWLSVMGRNKAIDWLRREGRSLPIAPLAEAEQTACTHISPENRIAQQQGLHLVHTAVAELPPRQRSVIALRSLQENEVAQTAQVLDIAEKTVYATEAHARERLKHHPIMREAWTLLSAVGAMAWALLGRGKQLLAHSFSTAKAASQTAILSKASVSVWTSAVTTASVVGVFSLTPRPQTDVITVSPITSFSSTASASSATSTDASTPTHPSESHSPRRLKQRPMQTHPTRSPVPNRAKAHTLQGADAMKIKSILAAAMISSSLLGANLADAKPQAKPEPANQSPYMYRKVTKIDFEATTLTGGLEKPMMSLYSGRARNKMKSLITFRKNFRLRLQESATNL